MTARQPYLSSRLTYWGLRTLGARVGPAVGTQVAKDEIGEEWGGGWPFGDVSLRAAHGPDGRERRCRSEDDCRSLMARRRFCVARLLAPPAFITGSTEIRCGD